MTTFKYLTDAEAKALTRSDLLERIMQQQAYYQEKRRKTAADEAAMDELGQIMRRYVRIDAAFDAAFATLAGDNGPSYWDTRPADDVRSGPSDSQTKEVR